MSLGLVTDSSVDLPVATLLKQNIALVSHRFTLNGELKRDWRDITGADLHKLLDSKQNILLEAPEPEDFIHTYVRFLEHHEHLLSLHLSESLSPAVSHANLAVKALQAEDRITVIDTGTVSLGLAEIVLKAAQLVKKNTNWADCLEELSLLRPLSFLLSAPKPRIAGNRLKSMLSQLKGHQPLLQLSASGLSQIGSIRSQHIEDSLIDVLLERIGTESIKLVLGVSRYDAAHIETLKVRFDQSALDIQQGRVQLVASVLGWTLGPGAVAVCAYPLERQVTATEVFAQAYGQDLVW